MKYYDIDGNEVSLLKLIKKEPEWAVSRMEAQIKDIGILRDRIQELRRALKKAEDFIKHQNGQ